MTTQTAEIIALALMADTTVYELEVNACNAAAMLRSQAQEIERLHIYETLYAELRLAIDPNEAMTNTDAVAEIKSHAAEIERLRDLLDKLPAELRCIAMDYGIAGNIEGVDVANYCADHIDAARAALEGNHAADT